MIATFLTNVTGIPEGGKNPPGFHRLMTG